MKLFSSGIMLNMCPANERQCYIVTLSFIGSAHTQNDPHSFNDKSYYHWICK